MTKTQNNTTLDARSSNYPAVDFNKCAELANPRPPLHWINRCLSRAPAALPLPAGELTRLMRAYGVTIRALAVRTQITMKRIRHLRNNGSSCPNSARDMIEAVTGTDPGAL